MTEIRLHGLVAKKFKPSFKMANISRPIDSILAIDANYDGFKNFFLREAEKNNLYQFVVNGDVVETASQSLKKKEIKTIDIVPVVSGSVPILVVFAVNLAIGLVMAGIQYLMTPIPENEPITMKLGVGGQSFWFASKGNSTTQYTSVPLGYGVLRVGSKIIESTILAADRDGSRGEQMDDRSNVGDRYGGNYYGDRVGGDGY